MRLAGWVERRSQAEAAAELSAAVSRLARRCSGWQGSTRSGRLARRGWTRLAALVGEPGVGALAAMWLASAGEVPEVEVSAEDALWVLVDMGAAMLDTMPPAEAVQDLTEDATHADLAGQVAEAVARRPPSHA